MDKHKEALLGAVNKHVIIKNEHILFFDHNKSLQQAFVSMI